MSPEGHDSENYQEAKRRLVIILSLIIILIECPREFNFALFLPCLQFLLLLFAQRTMASLALEWNHFQSVPGMESMVSGVGEGTLLDQLTPARRPGPFTVNIVPPMLRRLFSERKGECVPKGDLKIEPSNPLSSSHLPFRKGLTVLFGHCITENNGKCLWNVWH